MGAGKTRFGWEEVWIWGRSVAVFTDVLAGFGHLGGGGGGEWEGVAGALYTWD